MNVREMADTVYKAIDKHIIAFGGRPESVYLYVSREQHDQLIVELRGMRHTEMLHMNCSSTDKFMGYPLFVAGGHDNPHPEVRISFE